MPFLASIRYGPIILTNAGRLPKLGLLENKLNAHYFIPKVLSSFQTALKFEIRRHDQARWLIARYILYIRFHFFSCQGRGKASPSDRSVCLLLWLLSMGSGSLKILLTIMKGFPVFFSSFPWARESYTLKSQASHSLMCVHGRNYTAFSLVGIKSFYPSLEN